MITFRRYFSKITLAEAIVKRWSSEDITAGAAMAALSSHARRGFDAIKNGGLIFRGFHNDKPKTGFRIIDSTTGKRTSKDTDNLYQLIMADSEKMLEYPDRSNSLICATSSSLAASYAGLSDTYVLFPFDGTKVAVLNKSDIFDVTMRVRDFYRARVDEIDDLSAFFEALGAKKSADKWVDSTSIRVALKKSSPEKLLLYWVLLVAGRKGLAFTDPVNQREWESLKRGVSKAGTRDLSTSAQALVALEKAMRAGKFSVTGTLKGAFSFFKENEADPYSAMASELADPRRLKISLVDYGEALPRDKECWFSGKCVAIQTLKFAEILLALKKDGFPIHPSINKDMSFEIQRAKVKGKLI